MRQRGCLNFLQASTRIGFLAQDLFQTEGSLFRNSAEESHLKLMIGTHTSLQSEGSAFLSKSKDDISSLDTSKQAAVLVTRRDTHTTHQQGKMLYYKYCRKTGHTITNCYRKNGFPTNGWQHQGSSTQRGGKPNQNQT